MQTEDKLIIGGHEFESQVLFLGSGKYSMKLIEAAGTRCRSRNYYA